MQVSYEVRQQVENVNGKRLEVVYQSSYERPAWNAYKEFLVTNSASYFELVKVTRDEECIAFTKESGDAGG